MATLGRGWFLFFVLLWGGVVATHPDRRPGARSASPSFFTPVFLGEVLTSARRAERTPPLPIVCLEPDARSLLDRRCHQLANGIVISTFTSAARSPRKTLDSMATPCSVKARGR